MGKRAHSNQRNKFSPMMLFGSIGVGILLGLGLFSMFKQIMIKDQQPPLTYEDQQVPLSYENQPVLGDNNATVTMVEFGDFKCPACRAFHQDVLPKIQKDYIEEGKVKLVFLNYPVVNEDSYTTAIAGEAIYQEDNEAFWKFYDAVYENQKSEKWSSTTDKYLVQLTKEKVPGIDYKKIGRAIQNKTYLDQVIEDKKIGEQAGVYSTPAILINGKEVLNPLSYKEIKALIEEEL